MVDLQTIVLTFFLGLSAVGMAYLMVSLTLLAIRIRRQDRRLLASFRSNRETLNTLSRKQVPEDIEKELGEPPSSSVIRASPAESFDHENEQQYMPPELVEIQLEEEEKEKAKQQQMEADRQGVQTRCMAPSPDTSRLKADEEEALEQKADDMLEKAHKVEAKANEVEWETQQVEKEIESLKDELKDQEKATPSPTEKSSSPHDLKTLQTKALEEESPSEVTESREGSPASGESYISSVDEEPAKSSPKPVATNRMASQQTDHEPTIGQYGKLFSKEDSNLPDYYEKDSEEDIEDQENHEWIFTNRYDIHLNNT